MSERIPEAEIQRLLADPEGSYWVPEDVIAQLLEDRRVLREAAGQHMPRRADCPMCKALEATQP